MDLIKQLTKVLKFLLLTGLMVISPLKLVAQEDSTITGIKINFKTSNPGGKYSPKNIGAVWIEDSSGNFVKTLKRWAEKRKQYLYTWNNVSGGNVTDALTSATVKTHTSHEATWNLTDVNGNRVSDGRYVLRIEMTDKHAQGPLSLFQYFLGNSPDTLSVPDENYFHNISIITMHSEPTPVKKIYGHNPDLYRLYQNYPNPFNQETIVKFDLPRSNNVSLIIYDSVGRQVKRIYQGYLSAGNHKFKVNASDLPSGIYFYRLSGDEFCETGKCLLIK